jgi:hypothetical protein
MTKLMEELKIRCYEIGKCKQEFLQTSVVIED